MTRCWRIVTVSLSCLIALCACNGGTVADTYPDGAVAIQLDEFSIDLESPTLGEGSSTFRVVNVGNIEHELAVYDALGDLVGAVRNIRSARERALELDLATGTYQLICEIPGHVEAGMVGMLVVEG